MCGIAGVLCKDNGSDPRALETELRSMCTRLRRRGPDDQGIYVGRGVGIGMRRLAIVDPAGGRQPIANETGTLRIVCNGEIYNSPALRTELENRGHRFRTGSDVETVLHLYEDMGSACVNRLCGMYALAIWDEPRDRLFLARDRLGIKPLYYVDAPGAFLFGSEIKALLAAGRVDPALDDGSLDLYLAHNYVPGTRSLFRGIRQIPPASTATVTRDGVQHATYWDVVFDPDPALTPDDVEEQLHALLSEVVRDHLMSDVPFGAFLSGGTDSSVVVALMREHLAQPVRTFTAAFDESGYDESQAARDVASHLGTDHHQVTVHPDIVDLPDRIVEIFDEPFADASALPTLLVSQLARTEVKMVLSGDGGDEAFAGYTRYPRSLRLERLAALPESLRRAASRAAAALLPGRTRWDARAEWLLYRLSLPPAERYRAGVGTFPIRLREALYTGEARRRVSAARETEVDAFAAAFDAANGLHPLSRMQAVDLKTYLPGDILVKVDRASMWHSLEARVPLLDHRVVEFAARVPPRILWEDGRTKAPLKRVLARYLPRDMVDRPKRGFGVPMESWLRGPLAEMTHDLLLGSRFAGRGLFRPSTVRTMIDRMQRGIWPHGEHLWALLLLEIWMRRHLDSDGARGV